MQVRNAPTNYQNVVAYDAVVSVDNKDMKLKPGMTANVSIIIAERKDSIRVPNAALRFRPPDVSAKDVKTNATKEATTNAPGAGTNGGPGAVVAGGGGQGQGGGRRNRNGGGGSGGPGGTGRVHPEHQPIRTVYILADKTDPIKLTPVQVKVGISDGVYTEVTDGLKEGDQVVTGIVLPSDQAGGAPGSNPFGGGNRGFRRM
jgi:HlyD family secretion protein